MSSLIKGGLVTAALAATLMLGLTQCSAIEQKPTGEATLDNKYGSYLAGRYAASERDSSAAAHYFDKALKFDPGNTELLERALMSEVAEGDLDAAADHAEVLIKGAPSARIARLVIGVRAMRDGGYEKARTEFEQVSGNAAAEIAARLGLAYAQFSQGKTKEAVAVIGKLVDLGSVRAFALYHQAVIEDLSGSPQDATAHFEEANRLSDGESLRILQAYAAHLARNGQGDKAKGIYGDFLKKAPSNPVIARALARLEAGQIPDRVITGAKQGLAETLYGLAASLSDERAVEIPVFYLQLALALEPRHDLSLNLLGDRLETAERYDEAIAVYDRVERASPLYANARQQIAQNMQRQKRWDDAKKILSETLTGGPEDVDVLASLGDVYRGQEKYAEAAESYSKAIALIGTPKERNWVLFYTRGIAYERSKRWADGERDLKQALKLKPEQPLVMNYLAYSWVEQGVNQTEALAMLKRAVDLRPEDGFIIDSLGWAHYRLGDFKSAIKYLEQAILLEPGEPTVNDHLGDAYWRVGRKLEARYQWQHALSLKPEAAEEPKIRKKIEVGLEDKVPNVPAQAGTPQSTGQ